MNILKIIAVFFVTPFLFSVIAGSVDGNTANVSSAAACCSFLCVLYLIFHGSSLESRAMYYLGSLTSCIMISNSNISLTYKLIVIAMSFLVCLFFAKTIRASTKRFDGIGK